MMTQPYFKAQVVRQILTWVCLIFSFGILTVWAKQRFLSLSIDWSFALPTISLFALVLPIGLSVKDWFQQRIDKIDDRLEEIEPIIIALRDTIEISKQNGAEITKHLLRLESKIELSKQEIKRLKIRENLEENRQILRDIRNSQRKEK